MSANQTPIVTHINYSSRGGAGRAALRLHQALLEMGWLSFFVSVDNSDDISSVANMVNINLVDDWLTEEQKLKQRFFDYINWNYIQENRTDISNTKFSFSYPGVDILDLPIIQASDIIHLHWVPNLVTPTIIKKLAAKGKKIVWTLHDQWAMTGGCHYDAGCNRYQSNCRSCPQLQVDPFKLTESVLLDKKRQYQGLEITIITPSKWLGECVKKSLVFKDKRVEVLPNPLETDIFRPLPEEERLNNKRLVFGEDCLVIVFGNDHNQEKRKGFEVLVKVIEICQSNLLFSELVKEGKVAIEIFGNSPPQKSICGVPVFHLGNLDTDEKLVTAMNLADLFLFPSLQDNYPNTVVEAMSCGLPVMAFKTGGLPELIKDEINGFLVEPVGSALAFAETLLRVMENRENFAEIRTNARKMITPSHDFNNLGQRFIQLYLSLEAEEKRKGYFTCNNSSPLAKLFEKFNCSYDLDLEDAFNDSEFKSEIIEMVLPAFQQIAPKSWQSWQLYVNQLYPELVDKIPSDGYFDLYSNLGETLQWEALSSVKLEAQTETQGKNPTKNVYLAPKISLEHPLILKLIGLGLPPENLPKNLAIYANNIQLITAETKCQENDWELTALIPKSILDITSQLYLRFCLAEEITEPLKLIGVELKQQISRSAKMNIGANFMGIGWHFSENIPQKSQGRWMGKKATVSCHLLLTSLTEIMIRGTDIATDNYITSERVLDSLKVWVNDILVEKITSSYQEDNQWTFQGVVALTSQEMSSYCIIRLETGYGFGQGQENSLKIETIELLPVVLNTAINNLNILPNISNSMPTLPKGNLVSGVILEDEITLDIGTLAERPLIEINFLGRLINKDLSPADLNIYCNNQLLDFHCQSSIDFSCLIKAKIPQDILESHNQIKIVSDHNCPIELTKIYIHPQPSDDLILRANSSFNSVGLYPCSIKDDRTCYRWLGKESEITLPIPLARDKPLLLLINIPIIIDKQALKNAKLLVNDTLLEGLFLEDSEQNWYWQSCIFSSKKLEDIETKIKLSFDSEDQQCEETEFISSGVLFQQLGCHSIEKLDTKIICFDSSLDSRGWYDAEKQQTEDEDHKYDEDGKFFRWMGKQAEITIPTDTFFGLFPLELKIKGTNYITEDILATLTVVIDGKKIQGEIKNQEDKSWEFEGIIPVPLLQQHYCKNKALKLILLTDKVEFLGDNLQPFSIAVSQVILTPLVSSLHTVNLGEQFIGCGWNAPTNLAEGQPEEQRGKEFQTTASILMSYPDGLFVEFTIWGRYPGHLETLEQLSITVNDQQLSGQFNYSSPEKWCFQGIIAKESRFNANLCVVNFSFNSELSLEITTVIAERPKDYLLNSLCTEIDSYTQDKTLDNLQQYYLEKICTKFIKLASI